MATIQATHNEKQSNKIILTQLLKIKTGAKLIMAGYVDIENCLINDQKGNNRHGEFAHVNVRRVFLMS